MAPAVAPGPRAVAVAASGGRDSTALLHCTVRVAVPLGLQVLALHVHHGLMPEAADWLAQVRTQARRWGAGFAQRRLSGKPAPGESVEAWARRERYRALAEMAQQAGCGLVLLAHHRRDQAETLLLQALRGGGPAGLSAMPHSARRGGITWVRPWLDEPRERIEAYLRRHRLQVVDDISNGDARFARNRLRLQVWPALLGAFPDAEAALCGAATHAQHAAALAAEVAAVDLPALLHEQALDVGAWSALPAARRQNALRSWLRSEADGPVPQSLIDRLMDELPGRHSARWPAGTGELRLYRGLLRFVPMHGGSPARPAKAATGAKDARLGLSDASPPAPIALDLSIAGRHELPAWRGAFHISPAASGGVPADLLRKVQARARAGGERFSLAAGATPRSLKKQFQHSAIPAWQREGPLLSTVVDGRTALLFVPGLGTDARQTARPGAPRATIAWHPDADTDAGGAGAWAIPNDPAR